MQKFGSIDTMTSSLTILVVILLIGVTFGLRIPLPSREMYQTKVFPERVPRLTTSQARALYSKEMAGKPPAMKDLSVGFGQLDMDDETVTPFAPYLAVSDELDNEEIEPEKEEEDSGFSTDEPSKLLHAAYYIQPTGSFSGYGYGFGYVQPKVQMTGHAMIPVLIPVMQKSAVAGANMNSSTGVTTGSAPGATGTAQQTQPGLQQAQPSATQTQSGNQPQNSLQSPSLVQPQLGAVQPQSVQPQSVPVAQSTGIGGTPRSAFPAGTAGANGQTGAQQTQQAQVQVPSHQNAVQISQKISPQHIHIVMKPQNKYGYNKYY